MKQLIDDLKNKYIQKGHTEEEAEKFAEELLVAASKSMFAEMMKRLTGADLEKIEKCTSQEEANVEVKKLYEERTGRSAEKYLEEILPDLANSFYNNYQKN